MKAEDFDKRISDLENQRSQYLAAIAACEGAIQDTRHWKSVFDNKSTEDKETTDSEAASAAS